jgi:hypothetical protein
MIPYKMKLQNKTVVLNVKRRLGKDLKVFTSKEFLELVLGMISASKTLFKPVKIEFFCLQ